VWMPTQSPAPVGRTMSVQRCTNSPIVSPGDHEPGPGGTRLLGMRNGEQRNSATMTRVATPHPSGGTARPAGSEPETGRRKHLDDQVEGLEVGGELPHDRELLRAPARVGGVCSSRATPCSPFHPNPFHGVPIGAPLGPSRSRRPLRAPLAAHWPGAIFERLDPEIALAFLETPHPGARPLSPAGSTPRSSASWSWPTSASSAPS
jgi:hypothetical protein